MARLITKQNKYFTTIVQVPEDCKMCLEQRKNIDETNSYELQTKEPDMKIHYSNFQFALLGLSIPRAFLFFILHNCLF